MELSELMPQIARSHSAREEARSAREEHAPRYGSRETHGAAVAHHGAGSDDDL